MVHVYLTDVSELPDPLEYPKCMEGLSQERKEKILKYRQLKDRKQSLGAGLLLLKVLGEHNRTLDEIYYIENGKPALDGVCFNLSHSEDLVVCAVSEKPVGIDIEKIRNVKENLADRYFTDSEKAYLLQFEGTARNEEFIRLWTMKESYMKYTGEGMRLALNRFEFKVDQEVQIYRDGELCDCSIKEYKVLDYKLTVCAEEAGFYDSIIKM